MKILALEREIPGKTASDFQPYLQDEARQVWELYKAGVIRETYFSADSHEAVFMLECATQAEARNVLESLPLVRAGLIRFEIIPLAPYDGFERLFKTQMQNST